MGHPLDRLWIADDDEGPGLRGFFSGPRPFTRPQMNVLKANHTHCIPTGIDRRSKSHISL